MAKAPVLSDLTTQYEVMSAINTNNQNIEDAFQNTLSLDGSTPNSMQADLDMNGNDILNVNNLQINSIEVDGINVGTVAAEVEAQRILAEAAATLAAVDSARAELAALTAEGILDNFNDRYLGIKSTAPTVDNDGNPLVAGALYYNNSDGSGMNIWTDPDWEAFNAGVDLALLKANNLSDLPNSDTALTNLGLTAVAINLIKATSAYGQRLVLGLKEGAIYDRASQAEAEAGTSDTVLMTPLRTNEAIVALSPSWTETTPVATTSGTVVDVASIPAGVTDIEVWLDGVSGNSNGDLLLQIGTGGTPTTTGYVSAVTITTTSRSSTAGMISYLSNVSNVSYSGYKLKRVSGNIWISQTSGTTQNLGFVGGGRVALAGELDILRLTLTAGSFDLGQIQVRYK